ncbi:MULTISPECIES: XrtA system polysaccharide chain length determinant [unclassified Moritella]|uniref:XrtA system polysaccharide chain length determinant n=1 Tax=unclassified Moritella TaxID=2637987 RepID=UPI001BADE9ED|nr:MULTISPECIES: XrtA system polysaccharide chain length determinant [unclassified Moritella]QUM85357.1 chain length-determining protein [Moritella sp. 28]QUM89589.1 chain length-determining protein [Moritella sp. 36]
MEQNEILKYIPIIWQRICLERLKSILLITLISFAILSIGIYKPSVFNSEVTIFADTQNIIKPLLGKQTSVTNVKQSRTAQIRDVMYSPRQLNKVINNIYGKDTFTTAADREQELASIREKLEVKGLSGNYIKIVYQDDSPDKTYRLLNEIVRLFIEDSANTKRDESRSAYNFIKQQVASYKNQLVLAENKLKTFKSSHLDGTETGVESRISVLRSDIEDMKIEKLENLNRIYLLKKQLSSQKKFSSNDYEASLYHNQLRALQLRLENLLLEYKDDYPEVSDVRYQISNLNKVIQDLNSGKKEKSDISTTLNPLYQELKISLAEATILNSTIENRLKAFHKLIEDAYERRKRIANNQAELSELTRDYNVVRILYEDMLANKEKARISMVLDIEGQGVNYKIQEPATYPMIPSGLRFIHFVIAGPILGLLSVICLFAVKVVLDNKIRFASQLSSLTNTQLLISIDHTFSRSERKKQKINNILCTFYFLCALTIYIATALTQKYDVSIPTLITPLYFQLMELIK